MCDVRARVCVWNELNIQFFIHISLTLMHYVNLLFAILKRRNCVKLLRERNLI